MLELKQKYAFFTLVDKPYHHDNFPARRAASKKSEQDIQNGKRNVHSKDNGTLEIKVPERSLI